MMIAKFFATCFGIGYIQKGAGTLAALFCCTVWMVFRLDQTQWWMQLLQIVVLLIVGVGFSSKLETVWGHDSNRIVIDEWLGMSVTLFLLPASYVHYAAAFVLFRFFDIAKPLFIKRAEALPNGWGVMLDDLVAGIYSAIILHTLLNIFSF